MRGDVRPAVLLSRSAFYWAVLAGAAVGSFAIWRFVCSPFGMTLRGIQLDTLRRGAENSRMMSTVRT
jgi:branched-chain amino acid transport system permease protein